MQRLQRRSGSEGWKPVPAGVLFAGAGHLLFQGFDPPPLPPPGPFLMGGLSPAVDDHRSALGAVVRLLARPHTVGLDHPATRIREERIRDVVLLLKRRVAEWMVGIDAEDHGVAPALDLSHHRAERAVLGRARRRK